MRRRQFDWTWKLFHSNNWVAIAARHLFDELLIGTDPIEFAIATHAAGRSVRRSCRTRRWPMSRWWC